MWTNTLTMLLCAVLLLLVSSSRASHFHGTVITFYPGNTSPDGTSTVTLRYKLNFHTCTGSDSWTCLSGDCGTQTSLTLNIVDQESSGEWCQREGIMTRRVPSSSSFSLLLAAGNWISNTINNVVSWRAVNDVLLKNRSDIGRANASPQTTILPALRVPSNCRREFNLLAFDPDGDQVRCRFGESNECNPCNPPAVLQLSPSCTLLFNPVNSNSEGPYAVQLVMEDFTNQNIILTNSTGVQTTLLSNSTLSRVPVQFALRVGPAAPSCTEGLYLPRFLPPTPANRARLYAPLGQTLTINISSEANVSTNLELLFSGPHTVSEASLGGGRYSLSWTPSQSEDGESHPLCFVVQAVSNSVKYQSEFRCVIVTVGDPTTTTPATTVITTPTMTTTPTITTTTPTTTTPVTTTTPSTTSTTPPTNTTPTTNSSTTITPVTTVITTTTPATANTTHLTTTTPATTNTTHLTTTTPAPTNTTQLTTTTPATTNTTQLTTTTPATTNTTQLTTTTPATTNTTQLTTTTPATTNTTHLTTTTPATTNTTHLTTTTPATPNTTHLTTTTPATTNTTHLTTTTQAPTNTTHLTTTTQAPTNTTHLTTTTQAPTNTSHLTTTIPATTNTTHLTTTTPATTNTTQLTTTTPTTATTTPTTSPPPVTPPQDTTAVTAVPDQVIVALRVKISSSTPLSEEFIRTTIIELLRAELVRQGVPS